MWKYIIYLVSLICVAHVLGTEVQAQSNESLNGALRLQMKAIAKRYQDSVVLRWVPNNAAVWRISRTQGFLIERAEISGGSIGSYSLLTSKPLIQWTEQEWSTLLQQYQYADSTEEQLIAVASTLAEQAGAPTDMVIKDLSDLDALRENKNRLESAYTFAIIVAERSRVAANGLAMRFVDRTAVASKEYSYRVSMAGTTAPYIVLPSTITVTSFTRDAKKSSVEIVATGLDTKAVLAWGNMSGHTTFDVYRSRNGGGFAKLNETPIVTLRQGTRDSESNGYADSNLTNYIVYTYRIIGHNSFAEEEVIGTVDVMPLDLTPPPTPSGVRTQHVGVNHVVISWEMPEISTPDLNGFFVQRSRSEDGPFTLVYTQLLATDARTFLDTSAVLGHTLYYQVVAVDTAKNGSISFPVYVAFADSMPPSPAVLVRGSIDTAGVVRIIVQHPVEADVMGYRLLMANDSTHEFTVKREIFDEDSVFVRTDTVLLDTIELRSLTKYVFYQVVCLDYHYNESAVSNMLALPRPDIIAPVAPVITDYVVADTSVVVFYNSSTSRDVSHHIIQRRPHDVVGVQPTPWDSLARGGVRDSVLVDTTGVLSAQYQYAVVAFDSAGNQSPLSNIISIVRYDNGIRASVTNLRATYDSVARTVRIQWDYPDIGEPHSYLIYKQPVGGAMGSYALVKDQRTHEYVDAKEASADATYAVKVVCGGGAESKLSAGVVVRK